MAIPNRELSQFGSFLFVDNATKNIGIATTATPYVGIGTTLPTHKVTIIGDVNIDGNSNVTGIVSSTGFYLNGIPLVDAALETWKVDGNNLYYLDGNVGIGTSSYSAKLTVSEDISASRFISTVSSGIAPFTVTSDTVVTNLNAYYLRGGSPGGGASGDIVTIDASQTLTNKTLTSPTIASINNSGLKTVPTGIGTFVITGATGIVTSGMIADLSIVNADVSANAAIDYSKLNLNGNIVNSDISESAAIDYSKLNLSNSIVSGDIVNGTIANSDLANSTISGVSLGSTLGTLTFGTYLQASGSSYNGSSAVTIQTNATPNNTSSTIVARDSNGKFSCGDVEFTGVGIGTTVSSSDSLHILGTTQNIVVSVGGTIGIGTDDPNSGFHMAGPNGSNFYMDVRGVSERQLIFDNGNSYCYFYLNASNSINGESFGFLDASLSAYPSGGGANRNLWYYSPPTGNIIVGDTITTDIDNLKVGIGSTQPEHSLDVAGTTSSNSYITSGIVTTGNTSVWAVDASLTGHMYAEFGASVEVQIYNLFDGAEFKMFVKSSGGAFTLTVKATDDTGPTFTPVRIAQSTAYNDNVSTISFGLNDVRLVTVMNIGGNFVGGC